MRAAKRTGAMIAVGATCLLGVSRALGAVVPGFISEIRIEGIPQHCVTGGLSVTVTVVGAHAPRKTTLSLDGHLVSSSSKSTFSVSLPPSRISVGSHTVTVKATARGERSFTTHRGFSRCAAAPVFTG